MGERVCRCASCKLPVAWGLGVARKVRLTSFFGILSIPCWMEPAGMGSTGRFVIPGERERECVCVCFGGFRGDTRRWVGYCTYMRLETFVAFVFVPWRGRQPGKGDERWFAWRFL